MKKFSKKDFIGEEYDESHRYSENGGTKFYDNKYGNSISYKKFEGVDYKTIRNKNNRVIYCKNTITKNEHWFKYDSSGEKIKMIEITEKEFKKIKGHLIHKPVNRFDIINL